MKPFRSHKGVIAVLDKANVDTDQIIPKQFLKSISRTGFGPSLFYDWRYLPDGQPNPEFVLNIPPFNKATILITGNNFGCGSSREHAVWAIDQFGFRVVIAPRVDRNGARIPAFADIFRNNSFKNALLTIELSEAEVAQIVQAVASRSGIEATVDLQEQRVTIEGDKKLSFGFEIDKATKEKLLNGLDDIGTTLQQEAALQKFENSHDPQL